MILNTRSHELTDIFGKCTNKDAKVHIFTKWVLEQLWYIPMQIGWMSKDAPRPLGGQSSSIQNV